RALDLRRPDVFHTGSLPALFEKKGCGSEQTPWITGPARVSAWPILLQDPRGPYPREYRPTPDAQPLPVFRMPVVMNPLLVRPAENVVLRHPPGVRFSRNGSKRAV